MTTLTPGEFDWQSQELIPLFDELESTTPVDVTNYWNNEQLIEVGLPYAQGGIEIPGPVNDESSDMTCVNPMEIEGRYLPENRGDFVTLASTWFNGGSIAIEASEVADVSVNSLIPPDEGDDSIEDFASQQSDVMMSDDADIPLSDEFSVNLLELVMNDDVDVHKVSIL